jgi:hypothetical protein
METRSIVIERAVVRQDIMVAHFDIIHQVFRDKEWMSLFSFNKIYPRLVCEFYANIEIVHIQQQCLVLKTTIRKKVIHIDPDLISFVTLIPLSHPHGTPFRDPETAPSWEELLVCFVLGGEHTLGDRQMFIPIGWLSSPQ